MKNVIITIIGLLLTVTMAQGATRLIQKEQIANVFDVLGQATSTLSGHTTTYNHANYDTAYGWGNHAGLYDPIGQATSTLGTHTVAYNHANFLTSVASDSTWTTHNSYPSACGANTWTTTIGDTLTCSAITYAGITAMTSANFAGLISDETGTAGLVVLSVSPTFTGNVTMANASTTNLTVVTNSQLSTITSGTWNATAISTQYGGTGQNFSTSNGMLFLNAGSMSAVATGTIAGNGLTFAGTVLNFDGGDAPAGSLGGTWASPTVDSDGTWTVHGSYPSACSAGEYVSAIGDTLTCAVPTGTTYTAGDALTLTGNDFDFDGGASPAGELGGTWASPTVDANLPNLTRPFAFGGISTSTQDLNGNFLVAGATSTIELIRVPYPMTISETGYDVTAGTAGLNIGDCTNYMGYKAVTTTFASSTASTNNTYTQGETLCAAVNLSAANTLLFITGLMTTD